MRGRVAAIKRDARAYHVVEIITAKEDPGGVGETGLGIRFQRFQQGQRIAEIVELLQILFTVMNIGRGQMAHDELDGEALEGILIASELFHVFRHHAEPGHAGIQLYDRGQFAPGGAGGGGPAGKIGRIIQYRHQLIADQLDLGAAQIVAQDRDFCLGQYSAQFDGFIDRGDEEPAAAIVP